MGIRTKVLAFLERPKLVRWLVLLWIFVFSWFDCARAYYEENYGAGSRRHKHRASKQLEQPIDWPSRRAMSSSKYFKRSARETRHPPPNQLQWSEFPKVPHLWWLTRISVTSWMSYVIIKYTLKDQIDSWLNSMFKLQLPTHCYLVGRFVLEENLAEMTAACVSALALAWTWSQLISRPIRMDVVYFLILDERDLELVYSKFKSRESTATPAFEMSHQLDHQLDRRELFLLDTLCHRVNCPQGQQCRLRANRTREAHLKLRRGVSRMAAITLCLFGIVLVVMWVLLTTMHLLDQRYVRVYTNCDPELERLNSLGLISTWSITLSGHHLVAFVADMAENVLIWISIGLLSFLAPSLVVLTSYDLVLCWQDIDSKIRQLESETRGVTLVRPANCLPVMDTLQRSRQVQLARERELVFSISDFIHQVARVNVFLSRMLDCATIGILGLCAIYSYHLQTTSKRGLPLPLILMLCVASTTITICSYGFLLVHRSCNRTYTRLCSLVALDPMKSGSKLEATLDYFIKRRDCFLIMDQYPFKPTTFLTLIGWTFSCFCIISEVMSRNRISSSGTRAG